MTDEPTTTDAPTARAALLDRIRADWGTLQDTVAGLDDRQLTAPGPGGWAVKDHIGHLAHWEEYMLAVLEDRDPLGALELDPDQDRTDTAVNTALQARDAGRSAGELSRFLADTHARLMGRIEALDDAELMRRMDHIAGNTHAHYREHTGWIREQLS